MAIHRHAKRAHTGTGIVGMPGRVSGPVVRIAAVGTLALTVLAGAATGAFATTYTPDSRGANTPNVMRPLGGRVVDEQSYARTSPHAGTEFRAACGTPVVSSTPGVVTKVYERRWGGPHMVQIATTENRLTTLYAHMRKEFVSRGQIVQSGDKIGEVGDLGRRTRGRCQLHFEVLDDANQTSYNPTTWLANRVGKPIPGGVLLNHGGFNLVTFNVMGANHDADDPRPSWRVRSPMAVQHLREVGADVVGFQELQQVQREAFYESMRSEFTFYPFDPSEGTVNSIVWRQSRFQFVQGGMFASPYFFGKMQQLPYVLLREKATGKTAWFINVHNPVDKNGVDHESYRDQATRIQKNLVIKLRETGRPVFLIGDFNEREDAFCPLTSDGTMTAAAGGDRAPCVRPYQTAIDWIFGAGRVGFSTYVKDMSTKDEISDHPMIISRAHLGE